LITKKPSIPFFAAGFLIAIASITLGWLTPNFYVESNFIFRAMRLTETGRLIGISSLVVGVLLLTMVWLEIEHEIHSPLQMSRFALAASLPSLFVPPLFSRDVYSYIAQGNLMLKGFNPYQTGVSVLKNWFNLGIDPMWAETTTPYGSIYLLIEKFAAGVSVDNPYFSMVILRSINICAVILTIYGLNRLAKLHGISPNFAIWLAVLNPITILHLVNAVHNDALMIAALVWAFALAQEKHLFTGAFVLAIAIAIKPIALVALPFIGLAKEATNWNLKIRNWVISGAVALGVLIAFGFVTNTGFGWLNAITTPGTVLNFAAPITAASELVSSFVSLFGHDLNSQIFSVFRILGLLVSAIYIARLALIDNSTNSTRKAALAFACMIFLSPVVFPWYFLWPLALFAASGLKTLWSIRITIYGTLLVSAFSIAEAVVVRDSAITIGEVIFTILVLVSLMGLMFIPENRKLINLEEQYVA
jgi:hypothetical protein